MKPLLVFLPACLLVTSCSPASKGTESQAHGTLSAASKTLVFVHAAEVQSFAEKEILPAGAATGARSPQTKVLLNARLLLLDERGLPQPYLADAVPQLGSGTWQLSSNGEMLTTYHLRPGLTWHDGNPLAAEDFVFAWHVYANPQFGISTNGGLRFVDDVAASDPQTVAIHWKRPYPDAANEVGLVPPLPRHLLQQSYEQLDAQAFMAFPFWMDNYIGLGAWKLTHREPGSSLDAIAFDGFVFGRPKIDRIRVVYVADTNVAVSMMLAGQVQFAMNTLFYGEEGLALERGWASSGGGTVIWEPIEPRTMEFQMRPAWAIPRELATDIRVRQAVISLIDRESMLETITAGRGLQRDLFSHPNEEYFDTLARAVPTRYRFDPDRVQQLLDQAGFARGGDGIWVSPLGLPFSLEQWYIANATNERESAILVEGLRKYGIDATSHVFGVQITSLEDRAKSSGIFGGSKFYPRYHSAEVAGPDNRWTGANRFGYANADMDRAVDAWDNVVDRSERIQAMVQMERIAMDTLPAIPMYWGARVTAWPARLEGPVKNLTPSAGDERQFWTWYWES